MATFRTRTYGEVLIGKLTSEKPNPEASKCMRYFIDADGNRITEPEEFIPESTSPEMLKKIPCENVDSINKGWKMAKEGRKEELGKALPMPMKEELAEAQKIMSKREAVEKFGCSKATLERWTAQYKLPYWTNHYMENRRVNKEEEEVKENQELTPAELTPAEIETIKQNWELGKVEENKQDNEKPECFGNREQYNVACPAAQASETPLSPPELCPEGVRNDTEYETKVEESKPTQIGPDEFGEFEKDVWKEIINSLERLRMMKYRQVDGEIKGKLQGLIGGQG